MLFRRKKKKELKAPPPCTCSFCSLMNSLEPKLKNKPYGESLRKFIITPTSVDAKKSLREIAKEVKTHEKKGNIEEARRSYQILIGSALAKENVPVKEIRKYLNEYMKFSKRHRLSGSEYFPMKRDFSNVINHLDEIADIVRKAYGSSKVGEGG